MFVTVSLKIDVDATASLSHKEHQIGEAGRAAMKAALEQAIHQNEELHNSLIKAEGKGVRILPFFCR